MAKPLVEHKSTVTAPKRKRKRVPKGADDTFNVVSEGGSIRRIVFEGLDNEPAEEPVAEPEPIPEPIPEPLPERELVEFTPVSPPRLRRRDADMDSIHAEIDHLLPSSGRREPAPEAEPVTRTVTRRTTSRVEGSKVDSLLERVHFTDARALAREEPEATQVIKEAPPAPKRKPATKKPAAKKAPAKKAPAKKAAKKPAKRAAPKLKYDYKGDVHEVVDLEGIGPTYAKRLKDARITNTQELLFATDARLEKVTQAKPKTIQNWKNMAQLVKVKGIGPQFAEAMVRAGIDGIEELKTLQPKAAVAQIKEYLNSLETNVLGSGIGLARLTKWQAEAKAMRKVPIDLKAIEVVGLESREARTNRSAPTKKPATKKAPVKSAAKPAAKPAAKKTAAKATTCAAKTAAGTSCKRAPRSGSKYCASHKGYRA